MNDWFAFFLVVLAYVALVRWVLPRFGVRT